MCYLFILAKTESDLLEVSFTIYSNLVKLPAERAQCRVRSAYALHAYFTLYVQLCIEYLIHSFSQIQYSLQFIMIMILSVFPLLLSTNWSKELKKKEITFLFY